MQRHLREHNGHDCEWCCGAAGKHGAHSRNQWTFSRAVTEHFELGWVLWEGHLSRWGQRGSGSSHQSTPCEALPSVWISFAWQYSQACSHPCCLCLFSYPNSSFQSTLHLICFDTALCKQPHLSVMTLCDLPSLWRVSMFIFWIIAKSAVFPIIVVSKNKRYPEFILYGWSFIETQM